MAFVYDVVGAFQRGGAFMYPILFVLALGTAIVIEKFIFLTRSYTPGSIIWKQIKKLILDNKRSEAAKLCKSSSVSLNRIMLAGLNASNNGNRDDVQNSIDEVMMEEIPVLERRTHYIPVLANVSTLLGLLGTIMGLIEAFKAIAVAEPAQRSMLLAQGVSVAMNTTAFGLVVAIPLMLAYSFLQSKTMKIVDSLDEYSMKLSNLLNKTTKD